ncbi:Uma2 family endonuclease [soil metagenome]
MSISTRLAPGLSPRPTEHHAVDYVPPLRTGDRLTAIEFERRYQAMPELKKAELIEGVVYVGSPVSDEHGSTHFDLITWFGVYRAATPGVVGSDNGTVRLDLDNRPQPDVHLRIAQECGGQAKVGEDRYVEGAPELVAEVALSSASYDLHDKLNAYRRNGVLEYLAWRVENEAFDWFVLREGRYELLPKPPEGHLRSEVFPGLWLDPVAMIRGDMATVLQVLQQGMASAEHARFVERLQQAATGTGPAPQQQGDRP